MNNGVGDIGIALTGEPLVDMDQMTEEDRPKLIVGNKYIFNVEVLQQESFLKI